jgi:hypothetical protein
LTWERFFDVFDEFVPEVGCVTASTYGASVGFAIGGYDWAKREHTAAGVTFADDDVGLHGTNPCLSPIQMPV